MIKISTLEREVIFSILAQAAGSPAQAQAIVDQLVIADRTISSAADDPDRCCGFYLNFTENSALTELDLLPHNFSLQGTHPDLIAGGDFILFFDSKKGISFLEATFYGETLPTARLLSEQHGFTF
ncbi:hypothetical protein FNU76_00310 [Chitinimonas arctica]|uniref:Uncharacterized protein n=1 Tax=Chitinimonas arctica TaxID=2594795 RepID=A0A516S9T2_9NEIS|nr:hypothetical protein [Chitinimonas arctica]QDQ24909.1 hypothetical protein FNU76_00310 [Chitinimonas arctica]